MTKVNISVLFERPDPVIRSLLTITPLAPLSMVVSLPGSYYRTQSEPSKQMIYGLLENLLGWHFSDSLRKEIIKGLGIHYKKKLKLSENAVGDFEPSGSKYTALLQKHLLIEKPPFDYKPSTMSYDDYWTQHLKDVDQRHAKGNRNYDYRLSKSIDTIYEQPKDQQDSMWASLFKEKGDQFPAYYQKPTKREFVVVTGDFRYSLLVQESLLRLLEDAVADAVAPTYLGTNEGWVDLNLRRL